MTAGPSPDDVRQQMVTLFAQVAEGYEQLRFVRIIAARLLERAALQSGERVLDAGTGTGHVALDAASAVRPDGHVTGIDLSAAMLAHARRKAQDAGLTHVDFQEGDAQTPAFPDASVHVVMAASVIFLVVSLDSVDKRAMKCCWSPADRAGCERRGAPDSSATPPWSTHGPSDLPP